MKVLLLAGEESGLHYADGIAACLRERNPEVEIRGYADYGFKTSDLAVMGFFAVLSRLFFFLKVRRTLERAIDEWRPDVVCTVDYPGMNLRLAAYAKSRGIRAVHVVCPQVWAWKAGRIPKIESALNHLCCFFPFEPSLFKSGFAEFVGHPLVAEFAEDSNERDRNLVALLPGSRVGEVRRCLPIMLAAASRLDGNWRFAIPAANRGAREAIESVLAASQMSASGRVTVSDGGARALLKHAHAAVVASGTATLEAALARCPTVLVYQVSALLGFIARRLIKGVKHVGLVNIVWEKLGIIGNQPMVELLQEDFSVERTLDELRKLTADDIYRKTVLTATENTLSQLQSGDNAYSKIVDSCLALGA